MSSVNVVLDENQYGKPQRDRSLSEWCFYQVVNNAMSFITKRHSGGPILIAVTKDQYRVWKSWDIRAQETEA